MNSKTHIQEAIAPLSAQQRTALSAAMTDFGQTRASLAALSEQQSRYFNRSAGLLGISFLLLLLGIWPLLMVAPILIGTWWLIKAMGVTEVHDALSRDTETALQQLNERLKYPDTNADFAAIYHELPANDHRAWLASYLPGPVEVGRHKA